ncbi:helix-turn-helix domain-containing protein [Aaestuariibius violaceus]|uniref:helix-turn-helix domain-containing protein n=1 Tax=Aestuariibius violaceus TaxID=3234132 RepID=UPI00345E144C
MDSQIPTLPLPLVVSLILAALALRLARAEEKPALMPALLAACALQGLTVSLVQHYGLTALRPLQPVTATAIPPLAWIAFQSAARRAPRRSDALHAAGPLFTAFCLLFAPATLDIVVSSLFAGYSAAILIALWTTPETLPRTRLDGGTIPRRIWIAIAAALFGSAVGDGLIAAAIATDRADLVPWIFGTFSSLALLAIGTLSLSDTLTTPDSAEPPQDPSRDDADLLDRLESLMTADRLYLDPDLTLSRLARRLGVPVKTLSAAINRSTGQNVSRYINARRIAHACERLTAGDSVTTAMFESGFNTKSNFNREFARVTGQTPSSWKAARPAAPPDR